MAGIGGFLKQAGKKRLQRTKQKYMSGSSGGGSDSGSGGGSITSDIIQGAIRRKRAGKSRG